MKVIFVRHGKAAPYCEDDAGRDLTEFGRLQAQQTAEYLTEHYKLDLIIASPYNRADQTAKILLSQALALGQNPNFLSLSSITPDDDPVIAIDDLEYAVRTKLGEDLTGKCVAVVCHMPIVASIVAKLENLSPASFELAEARVLQMSVLAQGLATTQDTFIPDQPQ